MNADIGLWVQDRWRLDRLTLNYGLRLDMIRTGWPEQVLPPNPFTPQFRFEARDTFLNWKDLSPRVGAAYDLFGSGRTALKGSVARYVSAETIGLNSLGNPMSALSTSVNRTWTDRNGDRTIFNPDFTLQEAELGPSTNLNFGRSVQTTTVDPGVLNGWDHRPYTYEVDLGIQHQLASRASATAMFYHRWSGNHFAIANTAVTRADFSGPFCVTAPGDARLPDGGGYQVCGLYDVNAPALGRVAELVTTAASLGPDVEQSNTGLTLTADVRLANAFIQGGIDLRRDLLDTCGIDLGDHPAGIRFPIGGGAGIAGAADGVRQPRIRGREPVLRYRYRLPAGPQVLRVLRAAVGRQDVGHLSERVGATDHLDLGGDQRRDRAGSGSQPVGRCHGNQDREPDSAGQPLWRSAASGRCAVLEAHRAVVDGALRDQRRCLQRDEQQLDRPLYVQLRAELLAARAGAVAAAVQDQWPVRL